MPAIGRASVEAYYGLDAPLLTDIVSDQKLSKGCPAGRLGGMGPYFWPVCSFACLPEVPLLVGIVS